MLEGEPKWLPSTVSIYLYRYDFLKFQLVKHMIPLVYLPRLIKCVNK